MGQEGLRQEIRAIFDMRRKQVILDSHRFCIGGVCTTVGEIKRTAREILPPRYKEAFEGNMIEGKTSIEVAERMGIAQPNVIRYCNFSCEKIINCIKNRR